MLALAVAAVLAVSAAGCAKVVKIGEEGALTGKVEFSAGESVSGLWEAGIKQPSEGHLFMGDEEVHFRNTTDARKRGIGIIHQELSLFPNLPVYQNIFMAREKKKRFGMDNKYHIQKAADILKKLEHEIPVDTLVGELRVGRCSMDC